MSRGYEREWVSDINADTVEGCKEKLGTDKEAYNRSESKVANAKNFSTDLNSGVERIRMLWMAHAFCRIPIAAMKSSSKRAKLGQFNGYDRRTNEESIGGPVRRCWRKRWLAKQDILQQVPIMEGGEGDECELEKKNGHQKLSWFE